MKRVYLVWDYVDGDIRLVDIFGNMADAREMVVGIFDNSYSYDEQVMLADDNGFDDIGEFRDNIFLYDDYDIDLQVEVTVREIHGSMEE